MSTDARQPDAVMTSLRRRMTDGHSWPWWTPVTAIIDVIALIVAVLAWRYPQAPPPANPPLNSSSASPPPASGAPVSSLTVDAAILGSDGGWQSDGWQSDITTGPSKNLLLGIQYQNTSGVHHDGFDVKVILPDDTYFYHTYTLVFDYAHPNGFTWGNDDLFGPGIRLGDYSPQPASVEFAVKVKEAEVFDCTPRTLLFRVTVSTYDENPTTHGGNQSVSDEVTATVKKCGD